MNDGETNGEQKPQNGRDRKGRFVNRAGPGRPRKPRLADDLEVVAFMQQMDEATARIKRLAADIGSGLLSPWETREALRMERAAWHERGKKLRELEQRHS